MSNFQPQQLGLTAWIEGNRIDFSLHGPLMAEAVRCTAMRGKDNSELTLEGKALKVVTHVTDSEGNVTKLDIVWGNREIRLGRKTGASGSPSFYRSLSPSNSTAPTTEEDIASILSDFGSSPETIDDIKGSEVPDGPELYDDDIPF